MISLPVGEANRPHKDSGANESSFSDFGDLHVVSRTAYGTRDEQIVTGWNEYRGRRYVTVRRFARISTGQIVPTKSGVIFPADQLHFVQQGLRKIEVILKETDG